MTTYTDKIKAYKEILGVLEEHSDVIDLGKDYRLDIRNDIKSRIRQTEVEQAFDIKIPGKGYATAHYRINGRSAIHYYSGEKDQAIGCSDDGRQPKDEWLYVVQFPCGAYTLHEDYPTETFNEFFEELRSYKPKYSDTPNHALYFTEDVAKVVHEALPDILRKYGDRVEDELNRRRIARLQEELSQLRDEI